MANNVRLDRYLARIGVGDIAGPDLATLTALQAAHVDTIPFENFDPLLGRTVKLDLDAVQDKIVDGRRGGYCFEQNALLKAALDAIGCKVTGLGARVRWMSPPEDPLGPRTHMVLKVDLAEGAYLADVGFGGCLLDAPLRLETDVEQHTAMGTYRFSRKDGLFWLAAWRSDGWRPMYVFDMEAQIPSDYELGNWFTSTSPLAPFISNLIVERVSSVKRYKVINKTFITEDRDGQNVVAQAIGSADDMRSLLEETFNVTPPASLDGHFAKLGE